MKRLRERTDRAEFFRFREYLRSAVRGDQKNWYLRLKIQQIGDDLKTGDVGQKEIDDTKTEAPVARLVYAITTVGDKHNFVAIRLKHQPECVAY